MRGAHSDTELSFGWAGLGSQRSISCRASALVDAFPWSDSRSATVALMPEASSRFFGTGKTFST